MANFSYNPQSFKNFDLTIPAQAKVFVQQLSRFLVESLSPQGIAAIMNSGGFITSGALFYKIAVLGVVTTNQTVDCTGALGVVVNFSVATAFAPTLTLANLATGAQVLVRFANTSGGSVIMKIVTTTPALAVSAYNGVFAVVNMATGITVTAGGQLAFSGASNGVSLDLLQT